MRPPVPGCPLTAGQLQAVRVVADGLTYQQAAQKLGVTDTTIRAHLHQARRRLGARGAIQAVLICSRKGWLTAEPEPDSDIEITPQAKVFLYAFDLHLRSRADAERDATRQIMRRALTDLKAAA